MQGVHRESQEAFESHRGRHCQSSRAEEGVRDGSAGGRSEIQRVGGGGRRVERDRVRPISTSANFDFGQFDFGQFLDLSLTWGFKGFNGVLSG